jgi:hypothetical protein
MRSYLPSNSTKQSKGKDSFHVLAQGKELLAAELAENEIHKKVTCGGYLSYAALLLGKFS